MEKRDEESINELRKILKCLKQFPREIDIDLLEDVLKIPKSVLKEAKKEIKIPDDIKAEYKNFEDELKKYIKERKKRKNKKSLLDLKFEKEDKDFKLFYNKFNEIEKIKELYSKKLQKKEKRIEEKYEKIEKRINKRYERQIKKLNKQTKVKWLEPGEKSN